MAIAVGAHPRPRDQPLPPQHPGRGQYPSACSTRVSSTSTVSDGFVFTRDNVIEYTDDYPYVHDESAISSRGIATAWSSIRNRPIKINDFFPMKRLFSVVLALLLAVQLPAWVKLPAVLGSNMVLQRNAEVNFWGEASPRSRVRVTASWDGRTHETGRCLAGR